MALPAIMRRFDVELADSDRGVYETLELRTGQHPSETDRHLAARIIARCLEHAEGISFSRGLAASEEPALWQRDLRNDVLAWIDIGSPSVKRLHKASKTGARVVVYAWKHVDVLAREIAAGGVHRAAAIELHALDPAFLEGIADNLERKNRWALSVTGQTLYLTIGERLLEAAVERIVIPE